MLLEEEHWPEPTFKLFTVSTQNDHARLAIDWAVALATGGRSRRARTSRRSSSRTRRPGKPHPVECRPTLPGDIYLSAKLPAVASEAW
jgi:ribose transport system substrate-binding protein